MRNATLTRPLSRWERAVLLLLLFAVVGFSALVMKRSVFLSRRMGDVGVYFRAGWAVKAGGQDLYQLTDDNGWHYCYPPTFAVLMVPLADPPRRDAALTATTCLTLACSPGAPGPLLAVAALPANTAPLTGPYPPGGLPYGLAVFVFLLGNLVCLALSVHLLANALERGLGGPSFVGCRRWWWLRVLPVLVCLPPIGHTLMRGQVNLLLLLAVSAAMAALMEGRSWRAGLWLAAAVCLKIFPAYLLLVPLVRRDGRCLTGFALGLLFGLGVVPCLQLGPERTVRCYADLGRVMLAPALNLGTDDSRAKELIEVTATDNVSFQAILHNALHPDRFKRPDVASDGVRRAHLLLGATLTLLTLAAGWRYFRSTGPELALWMGGLTLIMLLSSPVCHSHYFALSVPLVMALLAVAWEREGITPLHWVLSLLFVTQAASNVVPLLPQQEWAKDVGLSMAAALALWLTGCVVLVRRETVGGEPCGLARDDWDREKRPERLPERETRTRVG